MQGWEIHENMLFYKHNPGRSTLQAMHTCIDVRWLGAGHFYSAGSIRGVRCSLLPDVFRPMFPARGCLYITWYTFNTVFYLTVFPFVASNVGKKYIYLHQYKKTTSQHTYGAVQKWRHGKNEIFWPPSLPCHHLSLFMVYPPWSDYVNMILQHLHDSKMFLLITFYEPKTIISLQY